MNRDKKIQIVTIGAGFGGLQFVKKISKNNLFHITLIDKKNHHLFQPLLYQVATAVLSSTDIAVPIRSLVGKKENVTVLMDQVHKIDRKSRRVYFGKKYITYDYLVVAAGAKTSFFGKEEWKKYTVGLKSLEEALKIRKILLTSLEKAENETDKKKIKELLNFVIVGGGPTGVELAGSIAELSKIIVKKEYKNIDSRETEVTLIEARPFLLSSFDKKLSEDAKKKLEIRGVKVLLNETVKKIDQKGVHLNKKIIPSKNIIWVAGVEGNSISKSLNANLDRSNRVIVNEFCQIPNDPFVFVIGDLANFSTGLKNPLPGVSPVAMQQGRYIAQIITSLVNNEPIAPFRYWDKGSMATIGRHDAVAEIGFLKMNGIIGWISWLLIHLFYQVGFKTKVSILITWIWTYLTFRAGARVIQEEVHEND